MKLLVCGCSFSSGWGFPSHVQSWPNILADRANLDITNRAATSNTNSDIFLSAVKEQNQFDLVLVQWSALGRITVSTGPDNTGVIISHYNPYLQEALPYASQHQWNSFFKIMSLVNQDWKHYFNLIDMVICLQQNPRVFFVNGLIDWDRDFFEHSWSLPFDQQNKFLNNLLQVDQYDDTFLDHCLTRVLDARNSIDQTRWINLTSSWHSSKIDSVSTVDLHPGIHSQQMFAEQVFNFIKEKKCLT
jgi:hypothetical protein